MCRARDRPQELADVVTQHLAELQIAADSASGDAHGAGTPMTTFTQDKTSHVSRVELLRFNLVIPKPLSEQSPDDLGTLSPRRIRYFAPPGSLETLDEARRAARSKMLKLPPSRACIDRPRFSRTVISSKSDVI